MYKTLNRLNVYLHGDENPYTFSDAAALSSGTTALSQVKNCRDIDTILNEGGIPTIIPYHAIDNIEVLSVRTEEEDPVDDNCIVDGGDGGDEDEKTGTLTIINGHETNLRSGAILISAALDGTYGDLTFSSTPPVGNPFPPGYLAYAVITNLAEGASITATGLPIGANVMSGEENPVSGTVPCTLTLS